MLVTVQAIVLSKIRYKDLDLIVKCYTKTHGIVSYLVKGSLSNKRKLKPSYFQQLSLLELETNHKSTRALQYIKEVKTFIPFETLHTNVYKSTLVLFISEILAAVLKEETPNHGLFTFITTSLQILDKEEKYANFHSLFLLELTKFLGFYPEEISTNSAYFNLLEGRFQDYSENNFTIEGENLTIFKKALGTKFDAFTTFKLPSKQRQMLLNMILAYFQLHLDDFKKPKSLAVLNQVFN